MTERFRMRSIILFFGIICALLLAACAGKDEIAPADVEKQAFEDLRTAVRDAVDDPDREAEAVRLVNQLERDLQQSVVHGSKSLKWLCSKMSHDAAEAMKRLHFCPVCVRLSN